MTEQTDDAIFGHLRALRGDATALRPDMDEVTSRLASLEPAVPAAGRDLPQLDDVDARQQRALDRPSKRLGRIERRIEIID